eukprot:s3038_g9.t1
MPTGVPSLSCCLIARSLPPSRPVTQPYPRCCLLCFLLPCYPTLVSLWIACRDRFSLRRVNATPTAYAAMSPVFGLASQHHRRLLCLFRQPDKGIRKREPVKETEEATRKADLGRVEPPSSTCQPEWPKKATPHPLGNRSCCSPLASIPTCVPSLSCCLLASVAAPATLLPSLVRVAAFSAFCCLAFLPWSHFVSFLFPWPIVSPAVIASLSAA